MELPLFKMLGGSSGLIRLKGDCDNRAVEQMFVGLEVLLLEDLDFQLALVDTARSVPSKEGREMLLALVHVLHYKEKAHLFLKELISRDIVDAGGSSSFPLRLQLC